MSEKPLSRIHPEIRRRARELRHESTTAEQKLWNLLRDRRLEGFKFRRQYVVGPFIADFYCAEKKIIVEVDGSSHESREEYDQYRTEWLNQLGLRMIRFSNADVVEQPEAVLSRIWSALHEVDAEVSSE